MSLNYVELTVFAINNVNQYCQSVENLKKIKQFGHATGLTIIAFEEFIRAMNFYILSVGDLSEAEQKKILASNDKTGTGNLATKIEEALEIALQIELNRWLQSKPESFEILASFLTAKNDFERNTFLDAMIEYLKGDISDYAKQFHQISELRGTLKPLAKIKHDSYFFVDKDNFLAITQREDSLDQYFTLLMPINDFGQHVVEFLKGLFINKDLFEKYKKFDSNIRRIWPTIFARFKG